jgi:rod shape-determining protein MreD
VRRTLTLALVILTAIVLQTTVFADVRLLGAKPELLYLVTIVIALLEGSSSGAVTGFACGMAQDFLLNQPKGITALTLTLLGYAVGVTSQYIVTQSALVPVVLVAIGTLVGVLFNRVVALLLGQAEASAYFVVRIALLSALYNAILTPIFFPLIRRLTQASTKQRVGRW